MTEIASLNLPDALPRAEGEAAFCALWRAFHDAAPDPTFGATFVHPHTVSPPWAARLRATALIGPYLFLSGDSRVDS